MAFRFSIKRTELPSGISPGAPQRIVQEEAMRALGQALPIIRNRMVEQSQFGATGTMRGAWVVDPPRVQTDGSVAGRVVNPTIQALVIDEGARPHRPPPRRLERWVRRRLGISGSRNVKRKAFIISRAIARRGLPGRRSIKGKFTRTFRALGGVIAGILGEMRNRIAERTGE